MGRDILKMYLVPSQIERMKQITVIKCQKAGFWWEKTEIKAKGDFMAMGGSFEKKRMKMNASMADQYAQNAITHLKNYLPGNVDLGTTCGKYYRVSCLSIIDPTAMKNTVLEENTVVVFNINEVLPQSIGAVKPYLPQFIDSHSSASATVNASSASVLGSILEVDVEDELELGVDMEYDYTRFRTVMDGEKDVDNIEDMK
uniref:Uncharacterized protein n=1 Tax=Cucumis melo TaxID=3656 RepID=A0A9I9EEP6_CUCME